MQVDLAGLLQNAFIDPRARRQYFSVGSGIISAIDDPPIPISRDLATDTPYPIGQHQGRCGRVIQVPKTYTMFFRIYPDGQCSADKASIKGQPAKGEQGTHRIFYKITPGLEAVKDLGPRKAKYRGINGQIANPVMRPYPDRLFLGLGQLLLVLFPPFHAEKEQTKQYPCRPAAFL